MPPRPPFLNLPKKPSIVSVGLLALVTTASAYALVARGSHAHGLDAPHFAGFVCPAGDGSCTGCVDDVVGSFDRLASTLRRPVEASRANEHGALVYARTLPPYGWNTAGLDGADHIQTVHAVRPFETATGTEWLVIDSQDQRYAGGGETSFHRGLVFARREPGTSELRGAYFYPLQDAPHPGGLQIADRYLAVGSDCHRTTQPCPAFVDFYDLGAFAEYEHETCSQDQAIRCDRATGTCTGTPCGPARFASRLYLDGSRGEPQQGPETGRVGAVAFTRLADGHYYLYVSRKSTDARGWYYRSDTTSLGRETKWQYVGAHVATDHTDRAAFTHWAEKEYQNLNFVTECGSNRLYLVGLGAAIDLYELAPHRASSTQDIDFAAWTPTLNRLRSASDGHCAGTREGAGIYVEPGGTMGLHCIEGVGDRVAAWQLFRAVERAVGLR